MLPPLIFSPVCQRATAAIIDRYALIRFLLPRFRRSAVYARHAYAEIFSPLAGGAFDAAFPQRADIHYCGDATIYMPRCAARARLKAYGVMLRVDADDAMRYSRRALSFDK